MTTGGGGYYDYATGTYLRGDGSGAGSGASGGIATPTGSIINFEPTADQNGNTAPANYSTGQSGPNYVTSALGGGSNVDTSTYYGGYAQGATNAQNQYTQLANQALQRQGAQIQNPYAVQDHNNLQFAGDQLSSLASRAPSMWQNAQGQNLAQSQFNAALNGNIANQMAAARSGRGIATLQGAQNALNQGYGAGRNALGQAGQTQTQQNMALGQFQNQGLTQGLQARLGLQNNDQAAAYQQAQLQQAQNAQNMAAYGQFQTMGQQAQLADLQARTQAAQLAQQQAQFNAQQNANSNAAIVNGSVGAVPILGPLFSGTYKANQNDQSSGNG